MRPKIGVVCTGAIGQRLIQTIENMQIDADFIWSDTLLRDESCLPAELAKSDVLLSSGYLEKALRRVTDKTIIKIEPSLFDILLAYSRAIRYDPSPVIILPSASGSPLVSQIQDILTVNIYSDYYDALTDIDDKIRFYKERGHSCIIGSGLVCDRAASMGMKSIFVYPKESLQAFIQLAYDTARSICKEVETSQKMSAVFQNTHQGILFTDERGVISFGNKKAGMILNMEAGQLTGIQLNQFFPEETLKRVFTDYETVKNVLCSFGGERYIVSFFALLSKGELVNVMVNLDDVRTIQKQELHIRNVMAQKGFIAKHRFENYPTMNPSYRTLIQTAKKFAKSDECLIILGETGVGKEVMAQSIHNYSARANNPFVAVNCSAISENLLESELFGYDEGAFTGAKKGGKYGYFEIAHRGTIFLDEIGELSQPFQSKLLRVIQERQLVHVGGNKVINFDARIIAATNRNLWDLVQQKKFREDLYYRLAVLELEIPPLRQRQEDIFPMFLQFVSVRNSLLAVQMEKQKAALEKLLCSHSWPGNVRELENFVKTILAVWDPEEPYSVLLGLIQQEMQRRCLRTKTQPVAIQSTHRLKDEEFRQIQAALLETKGNYTKAAALLGISRVTLWRKLQSRSKSNTTGNGEATPAN